MGEPFNKYEIYQQRLLLDSTWKVILSLRFVLVGGVLVDLAG